MVNTMDHEKDAKVISDYLYKNIERYIEENYVEEDPGHSRFMVEENQEFSAVYSQMAAPLHSISKKKRSLEDVVTNLDETFAERLFRLIDEKNMTDVEVYKCANIDRKLFSKIRSKLDYKPSKITAISLALAIQLNLDETQDLLEKLGYTLSRSSRFDVIIEFFIEEENYDVFEINEALYAFNEAVLK